MYQCLCHISHEYKPRFLCSEVADESLLVQINRSLVNNRLSALYIPLKRGTKLEVYSFIGVIEGDLTGVMAQW